jgi:hypothetical protein
VTWRTVEPADATIRRTAPPELAWTKGGDLLITGIPTGRCALEIALPGAAPFVTSVALFAENQTTELGAYTLAAGSELALAVTDGAGQPVRARIALAAPHLTPIAASRDAFLFDHEERVTDEAGRCLWTGLPAGRRVLVARPIDPDGGADAVVAVELPASGRVEAPPLVIRPAGSIHGVVRAARGPPLAAMTVAIEGGGRQVEATTDVDGRYEARGLAPGRYVVTVMRRDEAPPRDLGQALTPRANPSAAVEVNAGAATTRDFALEVD